MGFWDWGGRGPNALEARSIDYVLKEVSWKAGGKYVSRVQSNGHIFREAKAKRSLKRQRTSVLKASTVMLSIQNCINKNIFLNGHCHFYLVRLFKRKSVFKCKWRRMGFLALWNRSPDLLPLGLIWLTNMLLECHTHHPSLLPYSQPEPWAYLHS